MRSSHSQTYRAPTFSLLGFSFTSTVWTTTAYSWFAVTKKITDFFFPSIQSNICNRVTEHWGENPPFSSRAVTQHGRRLQSLFLAHHSIAEGLQERMYKDSRCFLGSHSFPNLFSALFFAALFYRISISRDEIETRHYTPLLFLFLPQKKERGKSRLKNFEKGTERSHTELTFTHKHILLQFKLTLSKESSIKLFTKQESCSTNLKRSNGIKEFL